MSIKTVRTTLVISVQLIGFLCTTKAQEYTPLGVTFSDISEAQYQEYATLYTPYIVLDSIKMITPGSFEVSIGNGERTYTCAESYNPCYYYKGFFPDLNSYIISHCEMEYCATFMLNADTGLTYSLYSPFDQSTDTPLLSPNKKMLLSFASSAILGDTYIALYTRSDLNDDFDLTQFTGRLKNSLRIHEAVWVDNHGFAMKVPKGRKTSTDAKPEQPTYIMGKLK